LGKFFTPDALKDRRYIGRLSFAINYKLHDLNVMGYHLVNLSIHLVNTFILYLIVVLTFRTDALRESKLDATAVAFFIAMLFGTHPLQTQAVTYIVQRFTSLTALWYLLSVLMYIKWRLKHRGIFYAISIVSAVFAMKTKEIAFTLPVVLSLYEFVFFKGYIKRRILYLLPLLLTMCIIPLTLIGIDRPLGEIIGDIDRATIVSRELSRPEYLFTEFRVIITYLRLLFFPVNQNLDYDYPVYHTFWEYEVVGSFFILFGLFCLGLLLLRSSGDMKLVGYGILWFFITLSVESSIIPIPDVIYEHRMYLPSVGVFIAVIVTVFRLLKRRWAVVVLIAVVLVLTGATYARNRVWTDELSFWKDVVSKSPRKARVHNNLGLMYTKRGMFEEAMKEYQIAIRLRPNHAGTHYNLGNIYLYTGKLDNAIEEYKTAIKLEPNYIEAHTNLGVAYKKKGLLQKAAEEYLTVLSLKPDFAPAHYNLANVYLEMGEKEKALRHYHIANKLDPSLKIPAF
jgi:tetratricopeptide (TPR) repeat protein